MAKRAHTHRTHIAPQNVICVYLLSLSFFGKFNANFQCAVHVRMRIELHLRHHRLPSQSVCSRFRITQFFCFFFRLPFAVAGAVVVFRFSLRLRVVARADLIIISMHKTSLKSCQHLVMRHYSFVLHASARLQLCDDVIHFACQRRSNYERIVIKLLQIHRFKSDELLKLNENVTIYPHSRRPNDTSHCRRCRWRRWLFFFWVLHGMERKAAKNNGNM